MTKASILKNTEALMAEEGNLVEFYTRPESPHKRYIGKIKSVSYKYLIVFHLVPAPGFEDRFPHRETKLVVLTDTFILRVLDTSQEEEKYAAN